MFAWEQITAFILFMLSIGTFVFCVVRFGFDRGNVKTAKKEKETECDIENRLRMGRMETTLESLDKTVNKMDGSLSKGMEKMDKKLDDVIIHSAVQDEKIATAFVRIDEIKEHIGLPNGRK